MIINNVALVVLVIVAFVLAVLAIAALSIILIRRKYALNWYQRTTLQDSEMAKEKGSNSSLHIVHQQISSRKHSDLTSSSEDYSTDDDKCALLGGDNNQDSPTLLNKLSRRVGFIQPPATDHHRVASSPAMGSEESKISSIKPILKQHKSDIGQSATDRRFSAPVIYGKASAVEIAPVPKKPDPKPDFQQLPSPPIMQYLVEIPESFPHTKLSATRSAPQASSIGDLESFTVPLSGGDKISQSAKVRLARRRTSMQDSIDTTKFNPELYKASGRAPTIKEEPSVDVNEPIGTLYLSLHLTTDTGLLKVVVHKADFTGFPSQMQLRMPYFSLYVTDSDSPTRHTRHSEDAQHPEIEETFLFEVGEELRGKKLICHLYDFDQFVKSEKVGVVQIKVTSILEDELISLQKPIDRCAGDGHAHDKDYVGELLFSINSNKSKENITLVIAKAKDLHIEDEISVLGLMVKVTVLDHGQKYKKKKTDHVKLSINPSFSQALTIQLTPQQHLADLTFLVDVCKVRLSSTEVIGRVSIGPDAGQKEADHWEELQRSAASHTSSLEWWHQLKAVSKKSSEPKS